MNEQHISLKSLEELRLDDARQNPRRFFIPAYQRGYRWSVLQVTQLLDDIREFVDRPNPQPAEFYCLQPLVVRDAGGAFEVVDGQQRLTTLLLILRHFNERLMEEFRLPLYRLDYGTRPGLQAFFENPTEEASQENADFFHFFQAMQAIKAWFRKHEARVEELKGALRNKTKVIWFQLSAADNPVSAFTRLNVGKIPLTNDELIRALFVRRSDDSDEDKTDKLRIAHEWDQIEKTLQNDSVWYFLNNRRGSGCNRVGFLFDLMAHAEGIAANVAADLYGVFHFFNERFRGDAAKANEEWKRVKRVYLMLEEWYEDRTLYHMIGFLVNEGVPINQIRGMSEGRTKSSFADALRAEIFRLAIGSQAPATFDGQVVRDLVEKRLDNIFYGNRPAVRRVLLLFNIASLLQEAHSNVRFPFDSYKAGEWDIEHIRSVADDQPERHDDRKDWLEHCRSYFESEAGVEVEVLTAEIDKFLALNRTDATNEIFDPLYRRILEYFRESNDGEGQHEISNLTLLDAHTNRSYKNSVYAVKRRRVLALDGSGIFVPLCTRNVFLKRYSRRVGNAMFWSADDQDDYEAAIGDMLTSFFCGNEKVAT